MLMGSRWRATGTFTAPGRLSTGRQAKLQVLRGSIPAAMMSAGSFSLCRVSVFRASRCRSSVLLPPRRKRVRRVSRRAVLSVLARPLELQGTEDEIALRDAEALARAAELVVGRALSYGNCRLGIEKLLEEIRQAPRCQGGEEVEKLGRSVWRSNLDKLPRLAASPGIAEVLRHTPELLGEATISAFVRDWNRPPEASVMVGFCCQETGVPAAIAVNIWKGLASVCCLRRAMTGRIPAASRRAEPRLSQGSGRANVCAMVEGIAESYMKDCRDREAVAAAVDNRWQRAHARIAVSSPAELASIAAGLVRGAEVVGYLTGEDEGSIADIDCALLTPSGIVSHTISGAEVF